jgi:hypothetical protein
MATLVTATNLQKLEFDVTTAEGLSHVMIVTGTMPILLDPSSMHGSFKALIDPILATGKFLKATVTASIVGVKLNASPPTTFVGCSIDEAEATLDDESSKVQIRI